MLSQMLLKGEPFSPRIEIEGALNSAFTAFGLFDGTACFVWIQHTDVTPMHSLNVLIIKKCSILKGTG